MHLSSPWQLHSQTLGKRCPEIHLPLQCFMAKILVLNCSNSTNSGDAKCPVGLYRARNPKQCWLFNSTLGKGVDYEVQSQSQQQYSGKGCYVKCKIFSLAQCRTIKEEINVTKQHFWSCSQVPLTVPIRSILQPHGKQMAQQWPRAWERLNLPLVPCPKFTGVTSAMCPSTKPGP